MLRTITLVCLLAAFAYGKLWNSDLKVTFGVNPLTMGKDHFIQMVKNIDQAIDKNWQRVDRPASPEGLESLELWCPTDKSTDYSFCVLFDDTGYIAGVQVAVDKTRISELVYDPDVTGFTSWNTTINGKSVGYHTHQIYFISAEILEKSKEERLKNRDPNLLIQHGYVWLTGINGKLYPLSTDTTILGTPNNDFVTQACLPWMGKHYYYKMTKDTTCSGETLFSWFPLMDSDQLIGIGFMSFLKYNIDKNVLDLFEHPDESAVKMIVPNGPECLYELAKIQRVLTMHIYFIDTPYLVGCRIFG